MPSQERDRISAFLEGTASAGASSEEVAAEVDDGAATERDHVGAHCLGRKELMLEVDRHGAV